VTSAILFASGDIIAQQAIERKRAKHDFSRTARLTFYGGCLLGPPASKWIAFLNQLRFATPIKAVIYRTWLDQTLMAPRSFFLRCDIHDIGI
jgi:protein Mpv17